MAAFIALLRAVNVGGTGKLPMSDLKAMCDALGFGGVRTYIASGNVVFAAAPEESLDEARAIAAPDAVDPEQEAVLADSIGVALLIVLQTMSPAERLAFVLHDMFDLPFAEIAPIVGRSENTAAQLASRARRRVRGETPRRARGNNSQPATDLACQRRLVDAFFAAARNGDFDALLAVLDSDVVLRADAAAAGTPTTIRGTTTWSFMAHRLELDHSPAPAR